MIPTPEEIQNAKLQWLTQFKNIWGERELPIDVIRCGIFNFLLNYNGKFDYTQTRLEVWKEII